MLIVKLSSTDGMYITSLQEGDISLKLASLAYFPSS